MLARLAQVVAKIDHEVDDMEADPTILLGPVSAQQRHAIEVIALSVYCLF